MVAFRGDDGDGRHHAQHGALLITHQFRLGLLHGVELVAVYEVTPRFGGDPFYLFASGSLRGVLLFLDLHIRLDHFFAFGGLFLGPLDIHHFERDLFPVAALCAVVAHTVLKHLVFTRRLVGAVLQVEPDGGAEGHRGKREEKGSALEHSALIMEEPRAPRPSYVHRRIARTLRAQGRGIGR